MNCDAVQPTQALMSVDPGGAVSPASQETQVPPEAYLFSAQYSVRSVQAAVMSS